MSTIKNINLVALSAALFLFTIVSFSSCNKNDEEDIVNPTSDNLPDITGYPIVGTNQSTAFNNSSEIALPSIGTEFFGQNANYLGNEPSYVDNGDGTVTDMVTGLMWQGTFDQNGDGSIDYDDKMSYDEIVSKVNQGVTYAGHSDWRLPTIKEMYSLIMFSGRDIDPESTTEVGLTPFINNAVFGYAYGDLSAGERLIDMQCATTAIYVSTEVEKMVFGVNFADGRIKGYGLNMMGKPKAFNYLLVRGNVSYGMNNFIDNGNGTISDQATGLMWRKEDSDSSMLWKSALQYAEGFSFAGYSDWRLPDAKELQSIVDYTRSPATNNSAAIDPVFNCSQIINEAGNPDYPWYWSNTTHGNMMTGHEGAWAAYLAFGRCLGNMPDPGNPSSTAWVDVHGAGAQRSDPKEGNPADYVNGHGPQGDAVRIYNHVRLVRSDN